MRPITHPMIRAASRVMCPCSTSPMNGSAISMATKIARIFGTNTRVISWICVKRLEQRDDHADHQPDQHQRRRHQHQRDDRVARNVEDFGTGHVHLRVFAACPRAGHHNPEAAVARSSGRFRPGCAGSVLAAPR